MPQSQYEFKRNIAIVIGINDYSNGVPRLLTAVPDAAALAHILKEEYQYEVYLLTNEHATLKKLKQLLEYFNNQQIPFGQQREINKSDRLLIYFAGHGKAFDARDKQEGPVGYLIPADATDDPDTYLRMQEFHDALLKLPCRHLLVILDCCFSGAFYWSSINRDIVPKVKVYKQVYDHYIKYAARQVITSTSDKQTAVDFASHRGAVQVGTKIHSPFAKALFKALLIKDKVRSAFGKALFEALAIEGDDRGADGDNDGIITANDLYNFVRKKVATETEEYKPQTPGICPLKTHENGEFIFLLPDHADLKDAPLPDPENSPYRGLKSYEEKHKNLYFGRKEQIKQLYEKVNNPNQRSLTVVLGASGTGKSSLVQAGLFPYLEEQWQTNANLQTWFILKPPIRIGESPLTELKNTLAKQLNFTSLNQSSEQMSLVKSTGNSKLFRRSSDPSEASRVKQNQQLEAEVELLSKHLKAWFEMNSGRTLLLVIDQFEELITLRPSEEKGQKGKQKEKIQKVKTQQELVLQWLAQAISTHGHQLRIVLTLRSDFESQFQDSALKQYWTEDAKFHIKEMTTAELREAITEPASKHSIFFVPNTLIDTLVDQVAGMPGTLPLLSFTLNELYRMFAEGARDGERDDRAITAADYEKLGGVARSLTKRAEDEYAGLVKQDPAHEQTIRRVMLRMVAIGGSELARRRVLKFELEYPEPENTRVKEVIKTFVKERLLVEGQDTAGRAYVEPAHDALVRGWESLLKWKEVEEEDLILQRRLTPAAEEWKSISSKQQPAKFPVKAEHIFNGLDNVFRPVENWVGQNLAQLMKRLRRSQNQQEGSREKPAQFLWNANPYLEVLGKDLNSDDNWFNQVEHEFVEQSILQKRRNIRWRWRIATAVIVGLSGLTTFALIGQRNAAIGLIQTARESSEAQLRTNQLTLDALISSLRAGKELNQHWLLQKPFRPSQELQNQVVSTLRRAVYLNREQKRWQLPQGEVIQDAIVKQDSVLIASTKDDGTVCVWDLEDESGQRVCKQLPENLNFVTEAEFSPDGTKLALIGEMRGSGMSQQFPGVYLWNRTNEQFYEPSGLPGKVGSFSFSPDSKALALISRNQDFQGFAYWWSWENDQVNQLTTNEQVSVERISFKPDGNLLVATTDRINRKILSLWLYESGKCSEVGRFKSDFPIDYAVISPNGKSLVVIAGGGRTVGAHSLLWNIENEQTQRLGQALSFNFSPDGNQLAIRDSNGTVRLVAIYGESVVEFKGHQGFVSELSFSADGKQLLTIGTDNTIRLWNIDKTIQLSSLNYQELPNFVQALSFSPDGKQVATLELAAELATPGVGTIHLYDSSSGQHLKELPQSYDSESRLIFNPKRSQLAVVEPDVIRLLNLSSGREEYSLPSDSASSLSFSPDGTKLAIFEGTVEQSSTLRVLDLKSKQQQKFDWDRGLVRDAIWKPDSRGDRLLVAMADVMRTYDSVDIWDFFSRKQLASLAMSRIAIRDIASVGFNNDGSLVGIHMGHTMILWDLQSNQSVHFNLSSGETNSDVRLAEISPDASVMATIENSKAKLWQLRGFDGLLMQGCQQVRSYLTSLDENNTDRRLCDNIPDPQPPIEAPPVTTPTPSSQKTPLNSNEPASNETTPVPSPTLNDRGAIGFEPGATSAQINSNLQPQAIDRYTFRAFAGQTAYITINLPQGQVSPKVQDPNGNLVELISSGANSWLATLPADGDYTLEVLNQQTSAFYTLGLQINP
jgi:WD40 repeat protein